MRRTSLVHVVLAVHATCAAADLVLAVVWSSWALVFVGVGWAFVASALHAHHRRADDVAQPARSWHDEPTVPRG
ncbi:hypothetical protein [Saccharothrix texasensis]|uniref:Uncharacterized protein n=1 Tax=Saccharothrix texasensis TaxID=103734 RepID=A0A3N1GXE2_9PSEU|nr:hypothetical protein [Saccharothrix texasensis]ROP34809.1 hypothetical protein EDD40_0011 [Saccharothrix texasensis]